MVLELAEIEPVLIITDEERKLCDAQHKQIDYENLDHLHYLGNYNRQIPVNIIRMMENAYDWEHLPFVHPSAFAAIEKVDSGSWGWRTKVELPGSGETQMLQLLVDHERKYWATTVLSGSGKGVHIHTQAAAISENEISVDVRFYLDEKPESDEMAAMTLGFLQTLYGQLYDEDQDLMEGRQEALDRHIEAGESGPDHLDLGPVEELEQTLPHIFTLQGDLYCLNQWQGEWVAYAATCPHLLGPLNEGTISKDGSVACPWHGYRFDIRTGNNLDGKCGNLLKPPIVLEKAGHIIVSV